MKTILVIFVIIPLLIIYTMYSIGREQLLKNLIQKPHMILKLCAPVAFMLLIIQIQLRLKKYVCGYINLCIYIL